MYLPQPSQRRLELVILNFERDGVPARWKRSHTIILVPLLGIWHSVGVGGYLGQILPEATKRSGDSH
ncbi:hypothetical protein H6G81_12720 [Scytonema hofmannii FACHB-248]|uniref:Uncharacterized protein n=1 Tax=Scytonema hofmannii FACHB-248 TaxID=1842502 RepID=A0ABR8GQP5_9CYAN|nr:MULTISPECIES: hypothetical protein [Nostocales]MBD2605375.1 hypothetical protein [Scytonema hofmannii FACHB-248]